MLSFRLKCSLKEIERMTTDEFLEWLAFLEVYDKQSYNKTSINNSYVKRR